MRKRHLAGLPALLLLAGIVATSQAQSDRGGDVQASFDTTGRSTLEQTIIGRDQSNVDDQPDGAFDFLRLGDGEPFVVREDLADAQSGRANRRESVVYSGQITDFQLADEESPARVEFLDEALGDLAKSAWRPQEALVVNQTDQTIRQLNNFVDSPVKDGDGNRARMVNAVMTGDLADNMQRNETEWVVQLLEGGVFENGVRQTRKLDPSSGTSDTCPGVPGSAIRDGDNPRRYTGVQDYDDYPGQEDTDFYDPDEPTAGFDDWPRYRGLMDRAQERFRVKGLKVPSYVAFGNHDSLVQGNEDGNQVFEDIATGCVKIFPAPGFPKSSQVQRVDPRLEDGLPPFRRFVGPQGLGLPFAQFVPPDENRQFVDKEQFKRLNDTGAQADEHGFKFVDQDEKQASNGLAAYYDFSPKPGVRYIVIDTVSEGGVTPQSSDGNLDDPQFEWLADELRQAQDRDELIVVFGHHATGSLTADVPDEVAPPCTTNDDHGHDVNPGCDRDPRSSEPLHFGDDLEALFHEHPNVIGYVAGHSHENVITPFDDPGGGDFWEIKSPAVADWPPQHRLIEVMDNRDGTLSIFATMLDHEGNADAPSSGSAGEVDDYGNAKLASIGRTLAYNDPQEGVDGDEGEEVDRNAELLIRDPRAASAARLCQEEATETGTNGDDVIEGTSGDDVIDGRGGDDEIRGKGGNDVICGGSGDDRLKGNSDDDRLFGQKGKDALLGHKGRDRLSGGDGADRLHGLGGADQLFGNGAHDKLRGNAGDDELQGGASDDRLRGGEDDDDLRGEGGPDYLNGGDDFDRCRGGGGSDFVERCEA